MTKLQATELLPKFLKLKGHLFVRCNSAAKDIFVGQVNIEMTQLIHDTEIVNKVAFPQEPTDTYTIVALLEGGQFISIKSIVEEDNIQELMKDVEQLHYIEGVQNGFDPITGTFSKRGT